MKNNNFMIYGYFCTITKKWYVGQTTTSLKKRASSTGSGYINSSQFWGAIQKHGWDNFMPHILDNNIQTLNEANEKEQY